ncbi:hypothetical protein H6F93_11000 [Leptolyngbya sp. FACHB-671]|uniref:DUF6885 family protein n=1 Tax=Leptolyngbya sp. FACHB-671 TaxID=2692812 RepID=UPI001685A6D5|nr:hypothetical protein [Leptolyngbya sp. FACHB-671]MBD2068044.1 hypothetical protein [Leptolyngbya sp. FACHB-671]
MEILRGLAASLNLLPGVSQIVQAHRLAGQQHDNLCGPYWAALLLRVYAKLSISTEQAASLAGSVLPMGDPLTWVPKGVRPRYDYGVALPQTDCIQDAGTAAAGLIEAVSSVSREKFSLIPLKADWSENQVEALILLCQENPDWVAVPICNLRTGHLWGSALPLGDAIAYLQGVDIQPPSADWNVGHFVVLAGKIHGTARSLLIVQDTYPEFGWDSYHLQPAAAIAAALNCGDGSEGGVLLFVATQYKAEVEARSKEKGFAIAPWDNGTPWTE